MSREIIPKAQLRINDLFNGEWDCPACGHTHEVWTIEANSKVAAARELKNLEQVSCGECGRKFEVA